MRETIRKDFEKYSKDYCLKKDWIFPFSEVEQGSKVILYGAGDVGQAYYEQIIRTGYCEVAEWVDKNADMYRDCGLCVSLPSEIENSQYDMVIIAVYDAYSARRINEELINLGVSQKKIVWIGFERQTVRKTLIERYLIEPVIARYSEAFRRRGINSEEKNAKEWIIKESEKNRNSDNIILPRLVVELTTVCTLKCKGCNNLIPLYREQCILSTEEVIKEIATVIEAVDGIVTLELLGGEPFAYRSLCEVMDYVLGLDKVFEVELTTNGTLVPSLELIERLNNEKVTIKISGYKESDKYDRLIKLFIENGIRYELYDDITWIDSGGVIKRNRSERDVENTYRACDSARYCKTLYKGKVYACARSASLYDLGYCNDPKGYLDINESKYIRSDIRDFFLKKTDPSCDYCDYCEHWRMIPAGVQL